MSSVKDVAENVEDQDIEDLSQGVEEDSESDSTDSVSNSSISGFFKRVIGAEPPPNPVESYQDHPLNYDSKESTSRMIRGAEGILGNLNRAVLELLIGGVQKYTESKNQGDEGFEEVGSIEVNK